MIVTIYLVLFLMITIILLVYSGNLMVMMIIAGIKEKNCLLKEQKLLGHPVVTVQLPIFNEKYVAARVIEGALKIDWPKDKLEIQILDDSTDETLGISRKLVEEYQQKGFQISLIHREERSGQKAGALRYATGLARGEFIIIYDADFIPEPSILKALIPYFQGDKRVGMIQTRWGHLNPDSSFLTKAQTVMIDAHFAIEQTARGGSDRLFLTFNGTGGIWRKSCIIDSGHWQIDTITEDCDLSYRAVLRQWKMLYIRDIENKAELPVELNAWKAQQYRWAKGTVQTAKKLWGRIRKSQTSLYARLEAFLHLTNYFVHPLLIINILLSLPIMADKRIFEQYTALIGSGAVVFTFAVFIPILFFTRSLYLLYPDWVKRLRNLPLAMMLGTGSAVNSTLAVLAGLFGRKSEFLRTPKLGLRYSQDDNTKTTVPKERWEKKGYRAKMRFPLSMVFEFLLGLYTLAGCFFACINGKFPVVPFYLLYTISFFGIFALGMRQYFRTRPYKNIMVNYKL